MLDFLYSIGDLINSLIMFILTALQSLVYLITRIPSYITFLSAGISLMPTVLIPFMLASVSIFVIYLILGRT